MMNSPVSVKIIGVGGIGQWLATFIAAELHSWGNGSSLRLIDGDRFTERNRVRQALFYRGGEFKAEAAARKLGYQFFAAGVSWTNQYLTREVAYREVDERDFVMLCGDNHGTRHLASIRCQDLNNAVLISGGNQETTGHILTYQRVSGVDLSPPIHRLNHAIALADLEVPAVHLGCADVPREDRQILSTNETVAHEMYRVFRAICDGSHNPQEAEIWLDIARDKKRVVQWSQ